MNEQISWLHLTDLHHGQSHAWLWPNMRQQFFDDLSVLADKAGPWDVVFFSGDFVQRGAKEEYTRLTEELVKLWEHLRRIGSSPVFVGVPGNHDLERPGDADPVSRQSHRWHQAEEEVVRAEFWRNRDCLYRTVVAKAFHNYSTWIEGLPIPKPSMKEGLLPGDFSAIVDVNGVSLGVVGLNTTYLQLTGGNYEGKLDIHTNQLLAVCDEEPNIWRQSLDVAVLMTHQPPGWFHPSAVEHLNEICAPERFHAHFCGHLHEPRMRDTREAGGPTRRLRQGPSLFGLEKYGINEQERLLFGYSLGQWRLSRDEGTETMWPRLANKTYDGMRKLGPDVGFHLTTENSVVTQFRTARPGKYKEGTPPNTGQAEDSTPQRDQSVNIAEERRIVLIEKPLNADSVHEKLKNVPRFQVKPENQHRSVRAEERARFANILADKQRVWLISDWAFGKEGFIAAALEQMGGSTSPDTFHLQCGGLDNCDGFQAAAETQLGLSFQEFLAAVAALPSVTLILDDLPEQIATGVERAVFDRSIVQPIADFCPVLHLVLVARQKPPHITLEEVVQLKPLEVYEARNYIQHHPRLRPEIDNVDVLERVHKWSDGLPMQLDRLLEDLRSFSVSEILDGDMETVINKASLSEPVPRALQQAVSQLIKPDQSNESYELLKVLTVLRDGEIFQSIKRFYPRRPFYPHNVSELIDLGLLQAVPISQTAADLTVYAGRRPSSSIDVAKLLRVPRQVRDYVNSLISEDERSDILRSSTELLFGQDWWKGKIRVRNALFNSYSLSAIVGPGNEHVVARHLLVEALQRGSRHQTQRAIQLGLGLCQRLLHIDRYRDAMIACSAMAHLLRDTSFRKDYAAALRLQALALRMVDRYDDSVEAALASLDEEDDEISDETKASVHLDLAFAYKSLSQKESALASAKTALDLTHPESGNGFQARSIIARLTLTGTKRDTQLLDLETNARNKGHTVAANNIAITLAQETSNADETLRLLDKVILSAKDNYNRTRAVIEKATILTSRRRASELSDGDRRLLSAAYNFSYSQRIGNMLDRCHKVLWAMFMRERLWAPLLRLYRFSSLIWRMTDSEDQDTLYLRQLDDFHADQLGPAQQNVLHTEIHYLERRRQFRVVVLET